MRDLPVYSKILQDEYLTRKNTNPRYSVRAFAKFLKISYSTLSLLLRGKVGLSKRNASVVARQLFVNKEEALYFVDLVIAESSRSVKIRCEAEARLKQYSTRFNSISLDIESFQLLSAWYTFPVMELIRMYGEKADAQFLAKRLEITIQESQQALDNLKKLGIVQEHKVTSRFVSLPDGPADQAAQKFHLAILDKAKENVSAPKEKRHINTSIVRMRATDLQWAAKELRELRRKLAARLEEGSDHDSVFSISTQWVRLDKSP